MRKIILICLSCLWTSGFLKAQIDTTINGITYYLFSPGLWAVDGGNGDIWPSGYVHCGDSTLVMDVINPTTGKTWMDRNLGASRVATSSTDADAYGDLYQWGRGADGHQCRNSATTTTLSSSDQPGHGDFILPPNTPFDWRSPQNTNLWQGVNGVNNPCPSGYRLPTQSELDTERASWNSNNSSGAFASPLKLPNALFRFTFGLIFNSESGLYWSSTLNGIFSRSLVVSNSNAVLGDSYRATGASVRCIKDQNSPMGIIDGLDCDSYTMTGLLTEDEAVGLSVAVPYTGGNGGTHEGQTVNSTGVTGLTLTLDSGNFEIGAWSLTYSISGTANEADTAHFALSIGGQSCSLKLPVAPAYPAGTVHCDPDNPTAVIDVLNPTTGKTWMDRNLGASGAATSSTDALSYGDLYQWGRRSDGHQCRTSPTTMTLSSTDQPAHGSFILMESTLSAAPYDWRSPQNNDLWQGVNGVNNPCPNGYRLPTQSELDAERLSWSSNNSSGAFASPLKLPLPGRRRYTNGSLSGVDEFGYYWSSTIDGLNAQLLGFLNNDALMVLDARAVGLSVRCIKN